MRPIGIPQRWNYRLREGQLPLVCKDEHDKHEECVWEEWDGLFVLPPSYAPEALWVRADFTSVSISHSETNYIFSRVVNWQDIPSTEQVLGDLYNGLQSTFLRLLYLAVGWRCMLCHTTVFTATRQHLAEHVEECLSRDEGETNQANYGSDGSGGW